MKNKVKLIIFSVILFLGINALIFIVSSRSQPKEGEVKLANVEKEEISILMIEPDYLNPLVSKNKYVQEVSDLIFDGLTTPGTELKAQPLLAKLLLTQDNLNWEITLRDDVKFHNGEKFTADDVIFTIEKIKSLGEASYFDYNVQNMKSIEKISDYKILINLNEYDNFLPEKLNFPILSKKVYQNTDLFSEKKYIGTGPYKISSQENDKIQLKWNENYYIKSEGNIETIDIKIISKTRPGFELLKLGEIDIADTNTEVGAYGRSAYNNSKYVTSVFEAINFNLQNNILKDKVIRQAILLGINRDAIINKELNGYGVYADIPINPNTYLYSDRISKYAFNPVRAQDLLTNSEWIMKDNVRVKQEEKLEFNLLINSETKNVLEKAKNIQNDLNNIGIKINLVIKSSSDYNNLIRNRDYDLAITDWAITYYPEFLYNFDSNSSNNIFGFKNEEYDYLVYRAKREILDGKLKEYFLQLQDIFLDELPMAGLYFETSTVYYNKRFTAELTPKINNIYDGIQNVIIEQKVD